MINKTVIRKEKKASEFTTIHNSILNDSRLTPIAFKLLVSILSDSDTFNLSQSLYMKRLGISENRTYLNAISKLEECGYLRKKELGKDVFIPKIKKANSNKIVYHYTISEFGNLNSEPEKVNEPTAPKEINNELFKSKEEEVAYYDKIRAFDKKYSSVIDDEYFNNVIAPSILKAEPYESIVEKFEKYLYEKVIKSITDSDRNPKAFLDFKNRVKDLIFNHKQYDADFMNTWIYYKLTKYKKQEPKDYETEMGDYYENPRD